MQQVLPLILLLVMVVALSYFFMVRPMRHREKQHDTMVQGLNIGDTVITVGGVYGQIERIDEDSLVLKIESGALMRVAKGGILRKPER